MISVGLRLGGREAWMLVDQKVSDPLGFLTFSPPGFPAANLSGYYLIQFILSQFDPASIYRIQVLPGWRRFAVHGR